MTNSGQRVLTSFNGINSAPSLPSLWHTWKEIQLDTNDRMIELPFQQKVQRFVQLGRSHNVLVSSPTTWLFNKQTWHQLVGLRVLIVQPFQQPHGFWPSSTAFVKCVCASPSLLLISLAIRMRQISFCTFRSFRDNIYWLLVPRCCLSCNNQPIWWDILLFLSLS